MYRPFSLIAASGILFTLACTVACTEQPSAPTQEQPKAPPALTQVTADRTDLLFRFRTEDGFATTTSIGEIPEANRARVQVVDLSLPPDQRQSTVWAQVFNLAAPPYKGQLVRRDSLESALRDEAANRPKTPGVIMYSASWCGVCTKARNFFKKRGIPFVEKDIEKTKGAQRELAQKARKAGVQANGVPVFDIEGQIITGFDANAILARLKGTPKGR